MDDRMYIFLEESILLWFARTEIYIFSKNQLLNLTEESLNLKLQKVNVNN